jgi:uncharacterized Zn finger protein
MTTAGETSEGQPPIDDAHLSEMLHDESGQEDIHSEGIPKESKAELSTSAHQPEEKPTEGQSDETQEVQFHDGGGEVSVNAMEGVEEVSEDGMDETDEYSVNGMDGEEDFSEPEDEEDEAEYTHCPSCLKNQPHERLKEKKRGQGIDILARCVACGKVHTVEFRPPKEIKISFTLSDGAYSEPVEISVDEDERLRIEDIFDHDDALWRITRIDDESGREMKRARAGQIASAWAVRCDMVRLKLTMTIDDISNPTTIECEPSKMFSCGTIMEVGGKKWRIRAIHTGQGKTLSGKRPAHMIRRIFLHPPPSRTEWQEESGTGSRRSTGRNFDRRNSQTRDPRGRDWSGRDDLRDDRRHQSRRREDSQQEQSDYDD